MDEKEAGKKTFASNEKLKANRASETEEQMKERLRIGREKDRARRITQKLQEENKRSSERLKQCDDNELERKLRLEKVVARLAVETEEERRARLEKMVATKRFVNSFVLLINKKIKTTPTVTMTLGIRTRSGGSNVQVVVRGGSRFS